MCVIDDMYEVTSTLKTVEEVFFNHIPTRDVWKLALLPLFNFFSTQWLKTEL